MAVSSLVSNAWRCSRQAGVGAAEHVHDRFDDRGPVYAEPTDAAGIATLADMLEGRRGVGD